MGKAKRPQVRDRKERGTTLPSQRDRWPLSDADISEQPADEWTAYDHLQAVWLIDDLLDYLTGAIRLEPHEREAFRERGHQAGLTLRTHHYKQAAELGGFSEEGDGDLPW